MTPKWMEIMKPYLEERDRKRDQEREKNNLFAFVEAGGLTLEFAANWIKEPVTQFASEMKQSGYTVPEQTV